MSSQDASQGLAIWTVSSEMVWLGMADLIEGRRLHTRYDEPGRRRVQPHPPRTGSARIAAPGPACQAKTGTRKWVLGGSVRAGQGGPAGVPHAALATWHVTAGAVLPPRADCRGRCAARSAGSCQALPPHVAGDT